MSKNIVICCDGTNNEFGNKPTNVLKLYKALKSSDTQTKYYNPGVGTLSAPTMITKAGKLSSKVAGLAFGAGIIQDIEEVYTHLMNQYEDGDRIYIFGFSRGAFTARAIAAMLHKCGLLHKCNDHLVPYVTKVYRYETTPRVSNGFRKTFSRRCKIEFLGLWDTVKSVGWVYSPINFPYSRDNPIVKRVRHAVAIDERRAFYRQNMWSKGRKYQDIKQVWFAGAHCDVGGGYSSDESGPAEIALNWMAKEMPEEIEIDDSLLEELDLSQDPIASPLLHDSLTPEWKLAEYLPRSYYDPADQYKKKWKIYRGEPRKIDEGAIIHQSVIDRMATGNYDPKNLPKDYRTEPW